ncbi:phosphatidylinositol-binding clathrin assembly protein LAP-like [Galendromus occidentalis]|uniref:Phosphatidylinositol-binding clathrin assembly protein LAP-like n=1 Tax=Galendromus occidentalis TaxID=34638 RepID=A0AAJ6QQE7_9ACAR|nr:phosphatidylinositol-binding clathrin assembly protein LAP-like [Galendromus occidentalis]
MEHVKNLLKMSINARSPPSSRRAIETIVKMTGRKCVIPKAKNLAFLVSCTKSFNVPLFRIANALKTRTGHSDCVVVLKALVFVHHLMCFGSEDFARYLGLSGCTFTRNPKMRLPEQCTMGVFIDNYMEYLNGRLRSKRDLSLDFSCDFLQESSVDATSLRMDEALRTIKSVQCQLSTLLQFAKASKSDFCDPIVSFAFSHIFEDLINLFRYQTVLMMRLLNGFHASDLGVREDILRCLRSYEGTIERIRSFEFITDVIDQYINFEHISDGFSAELSKSDPGRLRDSSWSREHPNSSREDLLNQAALRSKILASPEEVPFEENLIVFDDTNQGDGSCSAGGRRLLYSDCK